MYFKKNYVGEAVVFEREVLLLDKVFFTPSGIKRMVNSETNRERGILPGLA